MPQNGEFDCNFDDLPKPILFLLDSLNIPEKFKHLITKPHDLVLQWTEDMVVAIWWNLSKLPRRLERWGASADLTLQLQRMMEKEDTLHGFGCQRFGWFREV